MVAKHCFIEINPYHAETLFFYHAVRSTSGDDIVMGHRRLFGQPLFDDIPARKSAYSFARCLWYLISSRPAFCHFNTVNATFFPLTGETAWLGLQMVLVPIVAWLAGCTCTCIVHEAESFYDLTVSASLREKAFRTVIGWWFIRLFAERYVLAPEVAEFLRSRGAQVSVLDPRALTRFRVADLPVAPSVRGQVLCWVGPIVGYRRAHTMLLDLDPATLAKLDVTIAMICDWRLGDGPALRRAIDERGLGSSFLFLDRRPDDRELMGWARRAAGILCLYASPAYSRTKSSGARTLALAFNKPFVATEPWLGIYGPQGDLRRRADSLVQAIAEAAIALRLIRADSN